MSVLARLAPPLILQMGAVIVLAPPPESCFLRVEVAGNLQSGAAAGVPADASVSQDMCYGLSV
jgi:hypothetical protein